MDRKIRLKVFVSLGITFGLAILVSLSVESRFYKILEFKALDLRFALQGDSLSFAPVVHVDIDDQSLAGIGRWPWPRSYHAQLVDLLKECQARMVIMDVIFTEELKDHAEDDALFSRAIARSGNVYLPFYFLEKPPEVSRELRTLLHKDMGISLKDAATALNVLPESLRDRLPQAKKAMLDEAIWEIISKYPGISAEGVLEKIEETKGWYLFTENETYVQWRFITQKLSKAFIEKFSLPLPPGGWRFRKETGELSVPITAYSEYIAGSGFINSPPDIDGVTRKVPLFVRYGDRLLPQLSVFALLDFMEVKQVDTYRDRIIFKDALVKGARKDLFIPIDRQGSLSINWRGRWGVSYKHIPYYMILKLQQIREQLKDTVTALQKGDAEVRDEGAVKYLKQNEEELLKKLTVMVKDKICIVGLTATGTHDLRPIPLQENYPMVGVHSNLIDTILSERFIVRNERWVRFLVFLFTALVIGLGCLVRMSRSLLLSAGYAAGYFLAALVFFSGYGLWIDLVGPLAITVFGFSAITSYRFFTEEKEKLWIKQAFSHYISKEVITELLSDPSKLKLGGERRQITVLFSDVRGFTAFSETHQPEEVVAMLNTILSEQARVVFAYNGTLDKFVGDEVMAFFGAPGNQHRHDHALVAVRTAVQIQERMAELQKAWTSEKKESLEIGIGINTGEMVVGNIGSAERMDYTVIGDNVNLASRLCASAEKDEIIISESTYEMVKDHVRAEKLPPLSVKGKSKPIFVYRVLGLQ